LRVTGYGLLVTGYGLLVTGYWLRVASCALRGRAGISEGERVKSEQSTVIGE